MSILKTLPRDMKSNTDASVFRLCVEADKWQEIGEYGEAARCLSPFWGGVGHRPNLEGCDEQAAAKLLLCAGGLTAWLGDSQALKGVQDFARGLLSEAATVFLSQGDATGAVEAQIGIAVTYWREAEYDKAREALEIAFKGQTGGDTYLRLVIVGAMVEIWAGDIGVALKLYASIERFINNSDNHALRSRYHHNYGLALKRAGYTDKAFDQYNLSLACLDNLGNIHLRGNVLNNLGTLCLEMKRFSEGHEYLSCARAIFEGRGDESGVGQVDDSIAQMYLAENRLPEAEYFARRSVETLGKGDGRAFLVEALETHGKALARLHRRSEAVRVFTRASSLATASFGQERASKIALLMVDELTTPVYLESGLTFDEAVHRFEEQLLRAALQKSNKNLKEAAMMLGLRYDTLRWVLNHRHKSLISERSEVKARKRSIIGRASTKKGQQKASVTRIVDKKRLG